MTQRFPAAARDDSGQLSLQMGGDHDRPASRRTPRVLVVDDDDGASVTVGWGLRPMNVQVVAARSGNEALAAARHASFDLVLVDLRLPDMSGIELMRRLRVHGVGVPFIVVSGYTTVPVVVEAMKLGASTVLEKPVDLDHLIAIVTSLIGLPPPDADVLRMSRALPDAFPAPPSADAGIVSPLVTSRSTAERWARLVLKVVDSFSDPKTLGEWARAVNVSRTMLAECCRLVHVSPHDARDFARILRAIRQSGEQWRPEAVMDFADARTLRKMLAKAGLLGVTQVPAVDSFFERQQWIATDNPALLALRKLLYDSCM